MSYVDKNLIPGERIVYRATRQRFGYAIVVVPVVACLYGLAHKYWVLAGAGAVVAPLTALVTWARLASNEFAVTTKRVIVKIGMLQRRTVEIMLSKIEGISVDQTILGRIGNAGTVIITGTGGTRESFDKIADPLEFRRQVQAQLARMEDERLQALRGA
ncbi:MAG TPA: PH domain-containing protein [Gemmatimonadaceae bacterium]|jgi:uncharacterized membrane protein YdbT with pleckstrin-like domain|nr:PH domain-containing protein [Gemmatimonadaceae bacterium]